MNKNKVKKQIKSSIKWRIWRMYKFRCFYCGIKLTKEIATVDHKIARCNGGTNDLDNLVACCRNCNIEKSKQDQSLREYTKAIKFFRDL